MSDLQFFGALASLIALAVTCTWALRAKLADVERAIAVHIAEDAAVHARVVKLETARGRRK